MSDIEKIDVATLPQEDGPSESSEKVDLYVEKNDPLDETFGGLRSLVVDGIRINVDPTVPKLADGDEERRWSWLDLFRIGKKNKRAIVDWNAVATRPSVYDDAILRSRYEPASDYENIHRFDPKFRWTYAEENAVVRKTDLRVVLWAMIMFLALDIDRYNISQANSVSFLSDLGMNTGDYNTGNALRLSGFLIAELPSQLLSKKIGPDRWIPIQLTVWSIVAGAQFFMTNRAGFLATRFLIGVLQGGFIPDVFLYLSYFYKKTELSMRGAFFFTSNFTVYIFAGFLAIGLLQLDGVAGRAGWRWLFLVEGLMTFVVGIASFFLMPPSPTQTKTWFRPNGWYTEREEYIMTNRLLRDDPQKGQMNNRQGLTLGMLKESLLDFDLWPIYAVGLILEIPGTPVGAYLTLAYRELGFSTITTNLLSIVNDGISIINLLLLVSFSEYIGERAWMSALQPLWQLPNFVALYLLPGDKPWAYFAVTTILLGAPYANAILMSWVSSNAGSVRTRTVGASVYNLSIQLSGVISSYVYLPSDAPLYRHGNRVLIGICCMQVVMFGLIKLYYIKRNEYKRKKWDALTPAEQAHYLDTTQEQGSKRLDFQFFH